MPESGLSPFIAWENFNVIIGSSGAALTGLQFVVMALGAESRTVRDSTVAAFGTPTVVHFSVVLLLSAILSAPWGGLSTPALLLGAVGVGGIVYVLVVIRRARRQQGYRPVLEDWIWHTIIPFVAYAGLLGAAICLSTHASQALFVVAASSLLLLLDGIHNAWDTVTYMAIQQSQKPEREHRKKG